MASAVIRLGELPRPQVEMWQTLLQLSQQLPSGWALVGGQMVALHAAERGYDMERTTTDVDALLDVRTDPALFRRVDLILRHDLGFTSIVGLGGTQHRWTRNGVQVDVLVPEGPKSLTRTRTALGGVAVRSPAANQALDRSETVRVEVGGMTGLVSRPSLLGAIVSKAAAFTIPGDSARVRHLSDLGTLLAMARPDDQIYASLTRSDRRYLRKLADEIRRAPRLGADQRVVSRVSQYLGNALNSAQWKATPKSQPTSAPGQGLCGAPTSSGAPCRNPRGGCRHHHGAAVARRRS